MATFPRCVRNGQDSVDVTRDGEREYRVGFTVWQLDTETPISDIRLASTCPGLPVYLTAYAPSDGPPDNAALLQDWACRRPDIEAPHVYEVDCIFSTRTPDPEVTGLTGFPGAGGFTGGAGGGGNTSPQDQLEFLPKKVHWTSTPQTKLMDRDLDNVAFQTTVGEDLDPAVEIQKYRRTLIVQRWMTSFDSARCMNYVDSTNEDEFEESPPGKVRCIEFSGEDEYPRGRRLFNVRAVFEFEDHEGDVNVDGVLEPWSFEYEYRKNYGTQFRLNGAGPKLSVLEHTGVTHHNLQKNGDLLGEGQNVQYRKFRVRKKMIFNAMGL